MSQTGQLRVAVVTESFLPQLNGVTNSVLRVLETLRQRGHEALVLAPTVPSPRHLGYECHELPHIEMLDFAIGLPSPRLSNALETFEPDLIHVAAPWIMGSQAISWANRNGIPAIAVYQTDISGYLDRYRLPFAKPLVDGLLASIHQQATINLAPTPTSAAYLSGLGVGQVEVWGRGVDSDLFTPNNRNHPDTMRLREQLTPKGRPLIGVVGRLAAEKQVHRLLELMPLDAQFVLIGDGPERPNLERLFEGHPVTFLGSRSGQDLANCFAALDVFVHFGTEETFGQAIQEAQASGLAVVAPASGGPLHLIEHGQTGLLVEHGSEGGYLSAVKTLLEDFELRSRLGESARRRALGNSWASNNELLLGYYSRALVARGAELIQATT